MTDAFLNRRDLLLSLSGVTALAALPFPAAAQVRARLVVVGGGFGGGQLTGLTTDRSRMTGTMTDRSRLSASSRG